MSMLDYTKKELEKHDAFSTKLNPYLQRIVNAIPFATVDPRMKATIAVAQLVAFASQFRRNISLWDNTPVPINAISFVVTGSGKNKDSSVKAARKCFTNGYSRIDTVRKQLATKEAIAAASAAGEDPADQFEIYKSYLQPIPPIDIMPTTGPGLIQHINDISDLELSSGFMYAGEFADELAYNPDMMEDIKILSETYDLGSKEVKYTKGVEYRSRAIESQAVSALMIGSPGHILYDQATQKKFDIAFMSKLARRSYFCYTPECISEPDFTSEDNPIEAMITYEQNLENIAKQARFSMSTDIARITEYGIKHAGKDLPLAKDVFRLFTTYKRYNNDYADTLPNQDSTSALIRRHLQWKAIKLAGAFAIFDCSDKVTSAHYIDAIRFCELLAYDMDLFEQHLRKSDHERFADYMHTIIQPDGKAQINIHNIKKKGFLPSTSTAKLQELVRLCSAYDTTGIYSITEDNVTIQFDLIIKSSDINISYKPLNMSSLEAALANNNVEAVKEAKHKLAMSSTYGFETGTTTFADLTNLLSGAYAYTPFVFKNGVRGKDNILGGTKWLVFDIDHTTISASETHFMLSDINHHVALSSDPTNDYKYRVLIELDSVVDLDPITWKHFYFAVAEHLAISIDQLPQSQIFFSYPNRPLMSITDASPIEVRQFIIEAKEKQQASAPKPISTAQAQTLLADPFVTFEYCFECPLTSPGARSMLRMIYYAKDLGASQEYILDLLDQVQAYWPYPLEATRFERIQQQVTRMF